MHQICNPVVGVDGISDLHTQQHVCYTTMKSNGVTYRASTVSQLVIESLRTMKLGNDSSVVRLEMSSREGKVNVSRNI